MAKAKSNSTKVVTIPAAEHARLQQVAGIAIGIKEQLERDKKDEAERRALGAKHAASDVGLLISQIRGLVEEWYEKDNTLYCVASTAQKATTQEDGGTIECGVFSLLADQLADSEHHSYLMTKLDRVEQLLKAGRAGVSHG